MRPITLASKRGAPRHTGRHAHRCRRRYDTASLAALTGRALMIFRAGFALNIVGSFVKGLMPFLAFVAGFFLTNKFADSGTKKGPPLFCSFFPFFSSHPPSSLAVFPPHF